MADNLVSGLQGAIDLNDSFQRVYLAPSGTPGKQATGQLFITALDVNNIVYYEVVVYDGTNYWPQLTNPGLSRGQAEVIPIALSKAQEVWVRVRAAPTELTISAITNANPGVITVNGSTGLAQNWDNYVRIADVVGMTEVNGIARVKYVNDTTVNLLTELAADENTTGFGTYTSGGTITVIPAIATLIALEEDTPQTSS